jgi:hypothetical protein
MSERLRIKADDRHYLMVTPQGAVTADASGPDEAEPWRILRLESGTDSGPEREHVSLYTHDDRRLALQGRQLRATDAPDATNGEADFTLVLLSPRRPGVQSRFALRTAGGSYIRIGDAGDALVADGTEIDDRATFTADPATDMWPIALRAHDGRHHLSALNGGGKEVRADSVYAAKWETFQLLRADDSTLEFPNGAHVHLRAASGHYIGVNRQGSGKLVARSSVPGEHETFTLIISKHEGSVLRFGTSLGLRAYNGKLLCANGGGGGEVVAQGEDLRPWETFTVEHPLPPELIPTLTPERVKELGERHLADLIDDQRVAALEIGPRMRRVGVPSARKDLRRELRARARRPRNRLGRRLAWWRLVRDPRHLRDWRVWTLLAFAALWIANQPFHLAIPEEVWIVGGALLGVPIAASVVILWDEFGRSPWRAWRLRRRIHDRPARVLPSAPRRPEGHLIPQEDPLEGRLIPRADLFEEVVPGLLRRHHRDIQVLIGEPGSGKTMALAYLAGELSRIGLVPVLVPLRNDAADDVESGAKDALRRQLADQFFSDAEIDTLWRWLRKRNRLLVLIDDVDQIGGVGEPGFVIRRTLDELANKDLPIIVTARPAGIPAGVAASSIELGALDEDSVIRYVRDAAKNDPGARPDLEISDHELRHWIREGRLSEVPFYLELLAALFAAGRCSELESHNGSATHPLGETAAAESHPLRIRFRLLELFYDELADGGARRWLGIGTRERRSTLRELEDAALGMLRGAACAARARVAQTELEPKRTQLQQFITTDDRAVMEPLVRMSVSVHEVVDTGQRLRLLDHDQHGQLQFRHRIMQAYLAGRRLLDTNRDYAVQATRGVPNLTRNTPESMIAALDRRLDDLLDRHHPEKLTAQMTLAFAAMRAHEQAERDEDQGLLYERIMKRLITAGDMSRPGSPAPSSSADQALWVAIVPSRDLMRGGPDENVARERLVRNVLAKAEEVLATRADGQLPNPTDDDPAEQPDPALRVDPDNNLMMLTTAAQIAEVTGHVNDYAHQITQLTQLTQGATRWTKIEAINAIAGLTGCPDRWSRIWEFARDNDYRVRRVACDAIRASASEAYEALHTPITELIVRAAARSALALPLVAATPASARRHEGQEFNIELWHEEDDVLALKALGWVLPAIVSGLRELPAESSDRARRTHHDGYVRDARRSLEWLVALAFEGGHDDFEAAVAQGFKDDAMRHAQNAGMRTSGPGQVAANRELVADVGLIHASSWYSRTLLHQAVALYGIVGAEPQGTLGLIAWYLHPSREQHPFVRSAAAFAHQALQREMLGSDLWNGLIWDDEGEVVSRRATLLDDRAAQLVGDVTLLLNLAESRGEDTQAQLRHLHALPHCLSTSTDRTEILGAGCPASCGCGLCPYQEPPPDEPSSHRGISRAFCRQERDIAERRRPISQRIRPDDLAEFWHEMERRARS